MGACSRSADPFRNGLPFRAVNRPGQPGYRPALQRHHLIPRELVQAPAFAALFTALGPARTGFDDFLRNGLLLPATEQAAWTTRLPLHRGPHRHYTGLVRERIGAIERLWAGQSAVRGLVANHEAHFRLGLLQRALRRSLLQQAVARPRLNRLDPAHAAVLFRDLDAMAEELWADTAEQAGSEQAGSEQAGVEAVRPALSRRS